MSKPDREKGEMLQYLKIWCIETLVYSTWLSSKRPRIRKWVGQWFLLLQYIDKRLSTL